MPFDISVPLMQPFLPQRQGGDNLGRAIKVRLDPVGNAGAWYIR